LALACLAGACSKHDAEFGSFVPLDTAALDASRPQDTLRCATLNMSVGFPVSQLIFTDMADPEVAYVTMTGLYDRYLRTQPKDRIKAMAHAIDSLKLDVIGLQEVLQFKRDGMVVNDYLPELIEAIKAEGGPAYQVFSVALNDTVLSGAKGDSSIRIDFHEGNALLVHPALTVLAADSLFFYNVFRLTSESPTKSERALQYAKVRTPRGVVWQLYTTHLEVFPDFSSNQAAELVRFQQLHEVRKGGLTAAPQVILGDFNENAGEGAHRVLQDAGFSDTFDSTHSDSATTCCVAASALWLPDTAFSERRIDYIMARHWVKTVEHATALRGPFTSGDGIRLWASDHRMLHAVLVAQ
jgi:endonuclease/exonuclease/phosphatase family metal-dependent hydrolase